MKDYWKSVLLAAVGALVSFTAITSAPAQKKADLSTVGSVDLNRYSGKWYEIARYPNKFQKQCVGDTTATYTLKPENKIEDKNECLTKDGKVDNAVGTAKIEDKSTNAKLKVRFAPSFISWLPAVWGDYWIIDLGKDYEYAVVGDPDRKYFWILARNPQMGDGQYQEILRRAERLGFNPSRVQKTPQNVDVMKGMAMPKSE